MPGTTTSANNIQAPLALTVSSNNETLTVSLNDGRIISVPLAWYPRLLHGTDKEKNHWRLIGRGQGIHWPDLEEDISVMGLLLGRPSCEGHASFAQWLTRRQQKDSIPSNPRKTKRHAA